jgi:hypothetical protein
MLAWLMANWGWLLLALVLGGYYAGYVLAIRTQRGEGAAGKPRLPCDRC